MNNDIINKAVDNELNWDDYATNYSKRIDRELLVSSKRNSWEAEIERHIGCLTGKRVLDVGTGPGFFPVILGEKGAFVTGIDNSEKMLDFARAKCLGRNIHTIFKRMNVEDLDFSDRRFDCVIARNVTYALSDPTKAYKEWLRVLVEGGCLLIYDANWFNFLVDATEHKKVMAFLGDYHKRMRRQSEAYEIEVEHFYDHIISRPLTYVSRPEWDINFFRKENCRSVTFDYEVQFSTKSHEEQYENMPTPIFAIEVIK